MFTWGDVTLVDVLLGFGLIVVVPLAFGLDHPTAKLSRVAAVAGCLAAAGLALRRGSPMAIVMGVPWLVITVVAALLETRHWRREQPIWAATARVVAFAYLVFAAAWSVLELAGTRPLGVVPPFVELAAVHFTYAGFTASLLATIAAHRCAASRSLLLADRMQHHSHSRGPAGCRVARRILRGGHRTHAAGHLVGRRQDHRVAGTFSIGHGGHPRPGECCRVCVLGRHRLAAAAMHGRKHQSVAR
jgi:hypothetical protein